MLLATLAIAAVAHAVNMGAYPAFSLADDEGIYVSQDQILAELGADRRPMYVDGAGRVRWGNPYQTFVGNVNGSESNYTGFGTFYPPLVRIAKAHGANILAYGSMSADTIYARVIAGHPVVAFATWDWAWHPRRDYLSFDGQWVPWIGPYYASHVYTVVGVSPGSVLINDPIRGQYWISKGWSRPMLPSSTATSAAHAIRGLVSDASAKRVAASTSWAPSRSANPA